MGSPAMTTANPAQAPVAAAKAQSLIEFAQGRAPQRDRSIVSICNRVLTAVLLLELLRTGFGQVARRTAHFAGEGGQLWTDVVLAPLPWSQPASQDAPPHLPRPQEEESSKSRWLLETALPGDANAADRPGTLQLHSRRAGWAAGKAAAPPPLAKQAQDEHQAQPHRTVPAHVLPGLPFSWH